jgi:hypothetical protein
MVIGLMKPKVPWLPSEVLPGQKTERCPACGAHAFMPWTLRRDPQRVVPLRTWICAACQRMEEREETDESPATGSRPAAGQAGPVTGG